MILVKYVVKNEWSKNNGIYNKIARLLDFACYHDDENIYCYIEIGNTMYQVDIFNLELVN